MNKVKYKYYTDQLILWALCFVCLAIYLPIFFKSLAITILIVAVLNSYCSKTYSLKESFSFNKMMLPILLLYTLYAIGLTYSSNMEYAFTDIQLKLPLFIIPLILIFIPKQLLTKRTFSLCSLAIIIGMIINIFYLYVAALIRFSSEQAPFTDQIVYTHLSYQITPSYMALYGCIALILTYKLNLKDILKIKSSLESVIKIILYVFFAFFIVLLQSRSGLISLALVCVWMIADMFLIGKKKKEALILLIVFLAFIFAISKADFVNQRYSNAIETTTKQPVSTSVSTKPNSMSERQLIYKNIHKVIFANPIFGVGTGDVRTTLQNFYNQQHFNFPNYLNAHNQFLQTTVALGIIGLLVLLCCFVVPLKTIMKRKDYFLIAILCMIGIGFMFESMLERYVGTYFFALIYSLMIMYLDKSDKSIDKD